MEIIAAALLTICMGLGVVLRTVPFATIVNARQKKLLILYHAGLGLFNWALLVIAMFLWGPNAAFAYLRYGGIVYATITMIINVLVIRGRGRVHLFIYGVVLTCHYLLMTIPNLAVELFSVTNARSGLFVVLGVFTGILLLVHWPLNKLLKDTVEPYLELENDGFWNVVCFIPLVFFGTKFLNLGGEHNTGDISQLVSAVLYIAVVVIMCRSLAKHQERIRVQQDMEKQLADQKNHYAELKVRVEEARKTKHDMKHLIAAIRRYMDLDDKAGLQSYCNELAGQSESGAVPYTGNVAADGVLYHYMQQAEAEQIEFHYAGTIKSQGIADVDLCVLLGNALDNALTGCKTACAKRTISLIGQSETGMLSIVVRNTFDGTVLTAGERLLSRKREGSPGVGMASMKAVCDRYGGTMETTWDDNSFTVAFVLPLTGE